MKQGDTVLVTIPDDATRYPASRGHRGRLGEVWYFKTWEDGTRTALVGFEDGDAAHVETCNLIPDWSVAA